MTIELNWTHFSVNFQLSTIVNVTVKQTQMIKKIEGGRNDGQVMTPKFPLLRPSSTIFAAS